MMWPAMPGVCAELQCSTIITIDSISMEVTLRLFYRGYKVTVENFLRVYLGSTTMLRFPMHSLKCRRRGGYRSCEWWWIRARLQAATESALPALFASCTWCGKWRKFLFSSSWCRCFHGESSNIRQSRRQR